MRRARVLIADPLPLFRAGVRNLLRRESDLEVIEAGSSDDAAELLTGGFAEIALIDLALPPTGGIDLVRRVRPRTRGAMIVWSLEPSRDAVLESITAGAHGFLHKEISPTGRARAARNRQRRGAAVTRHGGPHDRRDPHARSSVEGARAGGRPLRAREGSAGVRRPRRTNREIAEELAISEFTVKRHMQNILQKLDVPSRRAAGRVLRLCVSRRAGRGGELGMSERNTPLVAVICAVPLLGEAVTGRARGSRGVQVHPRAPARAGRPAQVAPAGRDRRRRRARGRGRRDLRPVRPRAGDPDLAAREHGAAARRRPLGVPRGTRRVRGVDPQPRGRRDLRPPSASRSRSALDLG